MSHANITKLSVFLLAFLIAMQFAATTGHVWEDYYITWRSSKHLATGQGLVYNTGDRLHTFTSPLGVLLPAVCSVLTFNSSDAAALWLFRIVSAAFLGLSALVLLNLARRSAWPVLAVVLLIGWLALDSKIIDFSINGMETAFLVFFLVWTLYAHLSRKPNAWRHMGAAWAGLMWSRPDSFIFIALIAAGFWLFNDQARSGKSRPALVFVFLKAGLLTTVLYLPWFLFAWAYYGSPIPHTVVAKSGFGTAHTISGLLQCIAQMPVKLWTGESSANGTFLPSYFAMGGWPLPFVNLGRALAAIVGLLWIVPFFHQETRATSFAFFGAHVYLTYYPYFPFPWYLPSTAVLGIFCASSLLAQALSCVNQWARFHPESPRPNQVLGCAISLVFVILAANVWLTWESGRLFSAQQSIVEDGNRRKIGEWLKANSRPGDTVFMEPLGYIGYFSGLKTYDMPGLSSREVVESRHRVGNGWENVIADLKPQWLVLRPHEAENLEKLSYNLMHQDYQFAREFTVTDQLDRLSVCGLPYLRHDARFLVYERRPDNARAQLMEDQSEFPISRMTVNDREVTFAHAPSILVRHIPRSAKSLTVSYGFIENAYTDPADHTDGATFTIDLAEGDRIRLLASKTLDPSDNPTDRGLQTFTIDLPPRDDGARLLLRASPGRSISKDWTYWSDVEFK